MYYCINNIIIINNLLVVVLYFIFLYEGQVIKKVNK